MTLKGKEKWPLRDGKEGGPTLGASTKKVAPQKRPPPGPSTAYTSNTQALGKLLDFFEADSPPALTPIQRAHLMRLVVPLYLQGALRTTMEVLIRTRPPLAQIKIRKNAAYGRWACLFLPSPPGRRLEK